MRVALLFPAALRGHRLQGETKKLADARVLLSREALQCGALIGGDPDRDLPVRIPRGLGTVEIKSGDCSTNDLARGGEAMPFTAGLDSRDERFGKIKREWGRRFAR